MMNVRNISLLSWLSLVSASDFGGFQPIPFPPDELKNTIINGERATDGEFPFYAVFTGSILCGGALVWEDIVVTGAHCVDGGVPPAVRIGGVTSGNGELVNVADGIIHPSYRSNTLANDIAVLVLSQSSTAEIATYNTVDDTADGDPVIAMGYGRTNPNNGGGSSTLQKLDMTIVGDDECSQRFQDHDPRLNICVDNKDGGICFGDSGGPLVDANGLILGVASFIVQKCDSNFPDFYTRMPTYSDWLQAKICQNSANPPADGSCDGVPDDDAGIGNDDCFLLGGQIDFVGFVQTIIDLITGIVGG